MVFVLGKVPKVKMDDVVGTREYSTFLVIRLHSVTGIRQVSCLGTYVGFIYQISYSN